MVFSLPEATSVWLTLSYCLSVNIYIPAYLSPSFTLLLNPLKSLIDLLPDSDHTFSILFLSVCPCADRWEQSGMAGLLLLWLRNRKYKHTWKTVRINQWKTNDSVFISVSFVFFFSQGGNPYYNTQSNKCYGHSSDDNIIEAGSLTYAMERCVRGRGSPCYFEHLCSILFTFHHLLPVSFPFFLPLSLPFLRSLCATLFFSLTVSLYVVHNLPQSLTLPQVCWQKRWRSC